MKPFLPFLFALSLVACHDAPPSPPCRTSEPVVSDHANAGCVIFQNDQLLVLKHRFGGKMGIPGGTALDDEPAQCTAHRETWEETGLDVTVGERLGTMRYGFALFHCYPDKPLVTDEPLSLPWHAWLEITDAVWLAPEEIPRDQWRYEDQVELFLELATRGRGDGVQ